MRLPTGSSKSITKSENLATAADTCRPRLPVLIYSRPFVMSENCEMHGCQWYEVQRIKNILANKGNCGKRFGAPLYYLK